VMSLAHHPQSALVVVGSGECGRHMRGEDGHRYLFDEPGRERRHAIDVAGHGHSRAARESGRARGRGFVDGVDVEKPGGLHDVWRDSVVVDLQQRVAMPEDDALAGALVDQDYRVAIGGLAHDGVLEVDAAPGELRTYACPGAVAAERAEIRCRTA